MSKKRCYCISGLGADRRAFQKLDFGVELIHIEWIKPLKNESLESYSKRLSAQIDNSEPFLLLGLSFGGIVACEIAKTLIPEKIILISSSLKRNKLPFLFRFFGQLNLHRLILSITTSPPAFLAHWLFGTTTLESKQLLRSILNESDPEFIKWAIDQVLNMKNIAEPGNIILLHGTKDKLFALPHDPKVHQIENGGHFMIIENAEAINRILSDKLS